MTANDGRVPDHYASSYVHWDLVLHCGMGYLEGNATKYLARWRRKGGRADLDKALHYVAKLREAADRVPQPRALPVNRDDIYGHVHRFAIANSLNPLERQLIEEIAGWQYVQEVDAVLRRMPDLIEELDRDWRQAPAYRTLADPAPVPLTEENHHASRVGETDVD